MRGRVELVELNNREIYITKGGGGGIAVAALHRARKVFYFWYTGIPDYFPSWSHGYGFTSFLRLCWLPFIGFRNRPKLYPTKHLKDCFIS